MKVTAQWKMSEEYFQLFWRDWIRTLSRTRRWAVPVGLSALLFGLLIYLDVAVIPAYRDVLMYLLLGLGMAELVWHFWDKRRWFRVMRSASAGEGMNVLVFSENGIEITGPNSRGAIGWGGFRRLIPSKNGLFLILQKGISIYVPDNAINSRDGKSQILELYRHKAAGLDTRSYDLPELEFEVLHDEGSGACSIAVVNDDATPMAFVVDIFEKYLGLSRQTAIKKMMEIHSVGRSEITGLEQESANKLIAHIAKMAGQYGFPLKCELKLNE